MPSETVKIAPAGLDSKLAAPLLEKGCKNAEISSTSTSNPHWLSTLTGPTSIIRWFIGNSKHCDMVEPNCKWFWRGIFSTWMIPMMFIGLCAEFVGPKITSCFFFTTVIAFMILDIAKARWEQKELEKGIERGRELVLKNLKKNDNSNLATVASSTKKQYANNNDYKPTNTNWRYQGPIHDAIICFLYAMVMIGAFFMTALPIFFTICFWNITCMMSENGVPSESTVETFNYVLNGAYSLTSPRVFDVHSQSDIIAQIAVSNFL